MDIILIAAMDENNAIGMNNDLPWHLPDDFAHFKQSTLNEVIVMGRKTAQSLGGGLPKRHNWVLTREKSIESKYDIEIFNSIDEVLQQSDMDDLKKLWVIGGQEIYQQFLPEATHLCLTHVHTKVSDADTYFPNVDWSQWKETQRVHHAIDERHKFSFDVVTYKRI